MEVVVTSESSGQLWNICVWDPQNGTTVRTFKGGISCSKSLNLLGGDYIISSQKDKPILQVWALNRQDQLTSKMIVPGITQVLAVSPSSSFSIAGIGEQLYVWQVTTGQLLATLRRHYQAVTCIRFTADSSRFVSCGADGLVLVWSLEEVLCSTDCEPEWTWSDHSLPITDAHITKSIVQPLVFTTSLDQTCKVHEMNTGRTLLSIQFDEPLHSVVVNHSEDRCYVGCRSGKIHAIDLLDPPRSVDHSAHTIPDKTVRFVGHDKAVTTLSVSGDGSRLLSGSDDSSARLWDAVSGQCVRLFAHRGPITNAFFCPRYNHLEADKFHPSVVFSPFEKKLAINLTGLNVQVVVYDRPYDFPCVSSERPEADRMRQIEDQLIRNDLSSLRRVNRQLYAFAVGKILNGDCGENNENLASKSNRKRKATN